MTGIGPSAQGEALADSDAILLGKLCFGCNLDFKTSGRQPSEIRPFRVVKGKKTLQQILEQEFCLDLRDKRFDKVRVCSFCKLFLTKLREVRSKQEEFTLTVSANVKEIEKQCAGAAGIHIIKNGPIFVDNADIGRSAACAGSETVSEMELETEWTMGNDERVPLMIDINMKAEKEEEEKREEEKEEIEDCCVTIDLHEEELGEIKEECTSKSESTLQTHTSINEIKLEKDSHKFTKENFTTPRCKCSLCGKSFKAASYLAHHIISKHVHTRCKCHICGKSYLNSKFLEIHLRSHFGNSGRHCSGDDSIGNSLKIDMNGYNCDDAKLEPSAAKKYLNHELQDGKLN